MSVHKQPIGKASSQYSSQGILDASLVPGSPLGDEPLYYIEQIVDHKIKNAKREFLVKWWRSSCKEWVVEDNFHGKIPDVSFLSKSTKRKSTDAPEATRRSKRQRRIAAPIHREDEYNDPMDLEPTYTRRSQRSKTLNRSVDYGDDSDEDSSSDFAKNEARLSKSKSTTRRKPKKRTVSKKSPTGYTMIEAALLCLEGEGREMHAREIAKVCIQEGWINKTKTPHNSITAALNGHIKKHGQKSSFIKAGPNIFALSPLHKRKMKSKQLKTAKTGKGGSSTKGSKKKATVLDDDGEFSVPGVKPDKKSAAKATRKHSRRKVASPITNKKSNSRVGLKDTKTDSTFPGFKISSNGVSPRTTRSSRIQSRTTRSTVANSAMAKAKVSNNMLPTHSLTNGTNGGISSQRAPYSSSLSSSFYRDAADTNFPSHPPVGAEIKITEPPPELGFNNFNGSFLDQPFDQQMAQEIGDLSYAADIPTFKREICLGLGCGVLVEYPCEAQLIQCRQCGTVMEIDTASGSLVMTSPNHNTHKHSMIDMHPSLGI
mmetsp:Transcript_22937/g.25511  ORF Transcript_22937/g.25511 Transcript_22937/m.25511 type:complete len:542 (+) Transcript_22937:90-1715(+)